ncbi:MAG: ABC transporter permease [Anaerolineae bacterium]|nr:ABC transporter permease [Anaerolineae bacterium]
MENASSSTSRFSIAHALALACAILILVAFLLPWTRAVSGADLLPRSWSELDNVTSERDIFATYIFFVPAAAIGGILAGLLPFFDARRRQTAAYLALASGLAALAYYALFFLENNQPTPVDVNEAAGVGFWLALGGALGLTLLSALPGSKSLTRKQALDLLTLVLATLAALAVGSFLIALLGKDPIEAYSAGFSGAVSGANGVAQTLVKATPLLLVGLGICIAFRGGMINIGGEGQILLGALAATACSLIFRDQPGIILAPLTVLAGALAGAVWGGIPGFLKAKWGVNEILSTVMMNQIAVQLMYYLLRGPMIDPEQVAAGTGYPQSEAMPRQVWLLRLAPPSRLNAGLIIALALAVVVYVFLWRTSIGYRIRAVGQNIHAARYAGMNVSTYMTLSMTLSGALCGLAGAIEVMGVNHRILEGISGGYGFSGIVAALFGGLHPLWTVPASVVFGGLYVAAQRMQQAVQVPAVVRDVILGLIVLFVVSSDYFVRRRSRQRAVVEEAPALDGSAVPELPKETAA